MTLAQPTRPKWVVWDGERPRSYVVAYVVLPSLTGALDVDLFSDDGMPLTGVRKLVSFGAANLGLGTTSSSSRSESALATTLHVPPHLHSFPLGDRDG